MNASFRTGPTPGSSPAEDALSLLRPLRVELEALIEPAVRAAEDGRWVERIWGGDAELWSTSEIERAAIAERLGWLRAPTRFLDDVEELEAFASACRDVFRGAVLAGMGGSSLAPALFARTFGPATGGMPVEVLDSTDPAAVAALDARHPPDETLYLVATKSGTTTETLAFLAHFLDRAQRSLAPEHPGVVERLMESVHLGPERWAFDHFVAISDPSPSVDRIPYSARFREAFLNPPDVGGRYSALTYVGLVPAALLGLDLRALLESGRQMAERCTAPYAARNPGLALGLLVASLARAGIDKLTLVIDPAVAALGAWIEQLVAESTGKRGSGVVPVDGEALGPPDVYGQDRLFVRVALRGGSWLAETDARLGLLAAAGHPVVTIDLPDLTALGGEFFRWEFATAVAGVVLGLNAFDEPNVTESKRNTEAVLHDLPEPEPGAPFDVLVPAPDAVLAAEGPIRLVGDRFLRDGSTSGESAAAVLERHLGRIGERSYLAVTAFVAPSPENDAALARLRLALRDATGRATTVGYGPRYLHSTGQLHKGGTPVGWFLQLVGAHRVDLPVPDHGYTFGTLIDAQAEGDLRSLEAHGLPILRVHLGDDPGKGLAALAVALEGALAGYSHSRRGAGSAGAG